MAEGRLPGFGDPGTVARMADRTERAAGSLDELKALVQTDVSSTMRRAFDGEGATGFEAFAHRVINAIIPNGGIGSPARIYHEQIKPAVEAMKKAKELLDDAEKYINENRLYIKPDLTVAAMDENRPEARAQVAVGQGKLDVAKKAAENAREQIRAANEKFAQALEFSRRQLDGLGQIGGVGRGRPTIRPGIAASRQRPTPLTSKEEAFKAREKADADRDKKLDQQYTLEYERGKQYRQGLMNTYDMPQDGRTYVAHHNFPVKNHADFQRVGIDTTNPVWGSWVEARHHESFSKQYERAWDQYFATTRNPTPQGVMNFGRLLARTYNYPIGF
jgi:hypothetical protein